ncbi:TetR/AcrR family transcriptional regulator [Ruania halotolerans]|uniref:TetR/AcrR family transcriptional regulator n=1 Tax=Ruania halotolerans TaxID=2897773 RepID=UPI001E60F970|nr:TetR/AcrR family transcriptional regulator [Ruania halotolerans]UFU05169.1 TetR/AcrR family transcriptional regulator [Ruania halotolerans]
MARPRQYDDAVRRRLLDRASHLISTHGVGGLSLRQLAAEAETTTAAVYTLFGARDDLVRAVVDEGFSRFAAHLRSVERSANPGADLLALGMAYRRSARADPHFYRIMFGPGEFRSGADSMAEPTFVVLAEAVARLHPGVDQTRTQAEALRLWALAHGLVSLELAGLLPGDEHEHEARYRAALVSAPGAVGTSGVRTPQPPG